MREYLRGAFSHLLIPACVGILWGYAHMRSMAAGNVTATWREGHEFRTGNPYTAPVPVPPLAWRDPDEPAPQAIADLNAPDDARP